MLQHQIGFKGVGEMIGNMRTNDLNVFKKLKHAQQLTMRSIIFHKISRFFTGDTFNVTHLLRRKTTFETIYPGKIGHQIVIRSSNAVHLKTVKPCTH